MRFGRKQLGLAILVLLVVAALAAVTAIWVAWNGSARNVALFLASLVSVGATLAAAAGYVALSLQTGRSTAATERLLRARTQRMEQRMQQIASSTRSNHQLLQRMHNDQLRRVAAFSQHTNRMLKRVNEQQLPHLLDMGAESRRFLASASVDLAQLGVALAPERLAAADARAMQAIETLRRVVDQLISLNTENTARLLDEVRRAGGEQAEAALRASRLTSQQVAALFSLYAVLHPEAPLVPFGGWAVTPDTAAYLMRLILDRRPGLIVEAGSGLSTTLMGLALRTLGEGRLISLEHDADYHQLTMQDLERHGLVDYVELVHAPLRSMVVGEEQWMWYDLATTEIDAPIDVLVVDGPPGTSALHARYPAVPLLWEHFAPDALIVLDDAKRNAEREIVDRWLREYPQLAVQQIEHDKGTVELSRVDE